VKSVILSLTLILSLSACTTIQYTPAETKHVIEQLENDLLEAEEDLEESLELLKDCQPLLGG